MLYSDTRGSPSNIERKFLLKKTNEENEKIGRERAEREKRMKENGKERNEKHTKKE